jgi:hypothetical protein
MKRKRRKKFHFNAYAPFIPVRMSDEEKEAHETKMDLKQHQQEFKHSNHPATHTSGDDAHIDTLSITGNDWEEVTKNLHEFYRVDMAYALPEPDLPFGLKEIKSKNSHLASKVIMSQTNAGSKDTMLMLFFGNTLPTSDNSTRYLYLSEYHNSTLTWCFKMLIHHYNKLGLCPSMKLSEPNTSGTDQYKLVNLADLYYDKKNAERNSKNKALNSLFTRTDAFKDSTGTDIWDSNQWEIEKHSGSTHAVYNQNYASGWGVHSGTPYYVDWDFFEYYNEQLGTKSNITALPFKGDTFYQNWFPKLKEYYKLQDMIDNLFGSGTFTYDATDPIIFDMYRDDLQAEVVSSWRYDKPLVIPDCLINTTIQAINQFASEGKILFDTYGLHLPNHIVSLSRSICTNIANYNGKHPVKLHLTATRWDFSRASNGLPIYTAHTPHYLLSHENLTPTLQSYVWVEADYRGSVN